MTDGTRTFARPALLALALLLAVAACGGGQETVPFADLIANAEQYQGAELCTRGVYVTGFEVSALGASTETRDGVLYLAQPAIWVHDISAVKDRGACRTEGAPPGYEFCDATVCGTFETGGQFGHLGGYDYQIW